MSNIIANINLISKTDRNIKNNHLSPVIWLTGLSGSGKSTIANILEQKLFNEGIQTYVLDGDNIRLGLNNDLGFSDKDRKENMRRIAEVAKLFSNSGVLTITAFISPFSNERELCKQIIGEENFIEVFVNTDLSTCEQRDPKGLYKKARAGEIKMFTGIDSPYEVPISPQLIIDTNDTIDICINNIIVYLKSNNFIPNNQ